MKVGRREVSHVTHVTNVTHVTHVVRVTFVPGVTVTCCCLHTYGCIYLAESFAEMVLDSVEVDVLKEWATVNRGAFVLARYVCVCVQVCVCAGVCVCRCVCRCVCMHVLCVCVCHVFTHHPLPHDGAAWCRARCQRSAGEQSGLSRRCCPVSKRAREKDSKHSPKTSNEHYPRNRLISMAACMSRDQSYNFMSSFVISSLAGEDLGTFQ